MEVHREVRGAAGVAMLTGMVNIAVFAAFWPRVAGILRSDAEFKPICRLWQLDISHYGRQKWQRWVGYDGAHGIRCG